MPCYRPLTAYHARDINPSGKRSIVFNPKEALEPDRPLSLPCGQCVHCRLERSRQWAIRCLHEAKMHRDNCFITLTYDDNYVPANGSLVKSDLQKFFKRLRRLRGKLRYYACGEYGEATLRPHYHACVFGIDFPDKEIYRITPRGDRLYNSKELSRLWPFGFSVIGEVTFDSAAYVARYIMKKVTGEASLHHYNDIDYRTGEILKERIPEYTNMSLKPAIGRTWLDSYGEHVQAHDFVVINGKKVKPPKYYDRVFEKTRPFEFDDVKSLRLVAGKRFSRNNSPDRLEVMEVVHEERLKLLKRSSVR